MPAAGSKGAPKRPGELKDDTNASREEKQIIMRALSSPPFEDYRVWWSLLDSKYAGTALIVKKCFQPQKVYFNLDRKGLLVNFLFLLMASIYILKRICFQLAFVYVIDQILKFTS